MSRYTKVVAKLELSNEDITAVRSFAQVITNMADNIRSLTPDGASQHGPSRPVDLEMILRARSSCETLKVAATEVQTMLDKLENMLHGVEEPIILANRRNA